MTGKQALPHWMGRWTRPTDTVLGIGAFLALNGTAMADKAADLRTARALMEPDAYPAAQFGMCVEDVESSGPVVTVLTTGAKFDVDTANSRVVCHQRLGKARMCATILLPESSLMGATMLSRTDGAVILRSNKASLRVNGDSLLMFEPYAEGRVEVQTHFTAEYDKTFGNSPSLEGTALEHDWTGPRREGRLMLDNYGGIGIFPIGVPLELPAPDKSSVALGAHHVLWVTICPPRPFDWDKSFHDRPFIYGSVHEGGCPGAEGLKEHLSFVGNIYQLHGWVFKERQFGFVPIRPAELKRTLDTAHELGARIIVYTSPFYFTKGTPNEKLAWEVRKKRKMGMPWSGGENLSLFLAAIRPLIEEYGIDGLYYDNLYTNSIVQSYRLMRESRRILGSHGLLWIHTSWSPPGQSGNGYCPVIDAYADFVLRGEDAPDLATNTIRQRYMISCYNISNAIGQPQHNKVPLDQLNNDFVDALLDVNARFYYHGDLGRDRITNYYWPQLKADLKERVARVVAERNQRIGRQETAGD